MDARRPARGHRAPGGALALVSKPTPSSSLALAAAAAGDVARGDDAGALCFDILARLASARLWMPLLEALDALGRAAPPWAQAAAAAAARGEAPVLDFPSLASRAVRSALAATAADVAPPLPPPPPPPPRAAAAPLKSLRTSLAFGDGSAHERASSPPPPPVVASHTPEAVRDPNDVIRALELAKPLVRSWLVGRDEGELLGALRDATAALAPPDDAAAQKLRSLAAGAAGAAAGSTGSE